MLKAVQRPIANVVWKSLFLLAAGAGWQETRDSLLLRLGMNNWEGWSHFLGRQQIFYFSGKSFHVSNTKRIWQGRQPSSSPNALRLCQVRCDSFVPRLKPLRTTPSRSRRSRSLSSRFKAGPKEGTTTLGCQTRREMWLAANYRNSLRGFFSSKHKLFFQDHCSSMHHGPLIKICSIVSLRQAKVAGRSGWKALLVLFL